MALKLLTGAFILSLSYIMLNGQGRRFNNVAKEQL